MGRSGVDVRAIEDTRPSQYLEFSAVTIKKRSIALFFMRLPVFVPFIFMLPAWASLNKNNVLTIEEAAVLGTGGEFCLFMALSITPIITLTGAQWISPLRRWYGIWFAVIGIFDGTTAAITTEFAGGPLGRLFGHSFLLAGSLILILALPLLATANTPSQRVLGRWWKRLQRITYVIWGMVIIHLLLLDGFRPFGANNGDGDPVFHQRFYQALAISVPLFVLRLPPVRRWVIEQRTNGRAWLVWLTVSPMVLLWVVGFAFIINEEFFQGHLAFTIHPAED